MQCATKSLCLLAAVVTAAAAPLSSQMAATAPLRRAAETITAEDLHARLAIIADDSMMGRATPSPGLEMTAQYVADQFKRFGLTPGGENGTWFQRYPLEQRVTVVEQSHVGFMAGGQHVHADFIKDARVLRGPSAPGEVKGEVYLVGGTIDAGKIDAATAAGKIVVVVTDYSKGVRNARVQMFRVAGALRNAAPKGIVLLANQDAADFARGVAEQARPSVGLPSPRGPASGFPVVEVNDRAVEAILKTAGVDLVAIRSADQTVARVVAGLTAGIDVQQRSEPVSAPNTIGILEGTDPTLKQEYLVYSAHMDHIGITPGEVDSVNNGADDDGSGTVTVVELAEAFSRPGARPKRSIVFMTVSGEERGLWGSRYFSDHPTVPLDRVVADLNIDMIGRNWTDTVVAIGKEHSDLGATLARVNARHPELNMTAIDDIWPEENFYSRSDHFNFARKGVPILFFFTGVHPDYHQVSDEVEKIDSEKMARIGRLLFYLGQDIANAPERPVWNPESYKKIVQTAD